MTSPNPRCPRCHSRRNPIDQGKKTCAPCLAGRAARRARRPPGPSPRYARQFAVEMAEAREEGAKVPPVWWLACVERGYEVGAGKGAWT